jgi:hypothetical protein
MAAEETRGGARPGRGWPAGNSNFVSAGHPRQGAFRVYLVETTTTSSVRKPGVQARCRGFFAYEIVRGLGRAMDWTDSTPILRTGHNLRHHQARCVRLLFCGATTDPEAKLLPALASGIVEVRVRLESEQGLIEARRRRFREIAA